MNGFRRCVLMYVHSDRIILNRLVVAATLTFSPVKRIVDPALRAIVAESEEVRVTPDCEIN